MDERIARSSAEDEEGDPSDFESDSGPPGVAAVREDEDDDTNEDDEADEGLDSDGTTVFVGVAMVDPFDDASLELARDRLDSTTVGSG